MEDILGAGLREPDFGATGERIYAPAHEFYPTCRSITGNGVRASLGVMRQLAEIVVQRR
jgi:aminopeptidase-like protein